MKNQIDSNFAIAILVLVSACVGFAFWMYIFKLDDISNNHSPIVQANKVADVIDDGEASMTSNKLADADKQGWKTYTNDEYNFAIDLPEVWEIKETKNAIYLTEPRTPEIVAMNKYPDTIVIKFFDSISEEEQSVQYDKNIETIEDLAAANPLAEIIGKDTLGNQQATVLRRGGMGVYRSFATIKGGKYYELYYMNGDLDTNITEIDVQIKESFRFLDTSTERERVFALRETGSLELLKDGAVFIADLSTLKGYPKNETEETEHPFGSLYVWGESTNKRYIGFNLQPLGGGVVYLPLYYLDTENIDDGLQEIEGISVYPYIEQMVSPGGSKIAGVILQEKISEEHDVEFMAPREDWVRIFDLDTLKNYDILKLSEERTFFFPGHFGDDPFYPEWKDDKTVIIYDFNKVDLRAEDERTSFQIGEEWIKTNRNPNIINL